MQDDKGVFRFEAELKISPCPCPWYDVLEKTLP